MSIMACLEWPSFHEGSGSATVADAERIRLVINATMRLDRGCTDFLIILLLILKMRPTSHSGYEPAAINGIHSFGLNSGATRNPLLNGGEGRVIRARALTPPGPPSLRDDFVSHRSAVLGSNRRVRTKTLA